jgi:hypothetical protein
MNAYCRLLVIAALMTPLFACDEISDSSRVASTSAKRVVHDTKEQWKDLLTYSPSKPITPLPQTRYCYRMQADVVCYDSAQTTLASPLVGYQDGDNYSFYQPGGGSVGYSDGKPTSIYTAQDLKPVTEDMLTVNAAPVAEVIEAKPNPAPFKKAVK